MPELSLDYETYSELSLKTHKVVRYTRHPSTDIMSLAWSLDGGDPQVWVPCMGTPPPKLIEVLKDPQVTVHAFNAAFEWYCTRELGWLYGLPEIDYRRMRCSSGQALHANVATDLDTVCLMLGLQGKDDEGHKAMMRLARDAKPTKKNPIGGRLRDPQLEALMYRYNKQDVSCEIAVKEALPPLPPEEQEIWELDRRINLRGIPIDLDFCRGGLQILEQATERVQEPLAELMERTGGNVERGTQVARILSYVNQRGLNIDNLQADTISEILTQEIPEECRTVLELRQMVSSMAVKKFQAAADTHWEGRCYETQRYHKAHTGRWQGDGLNPFNFKKGKRGIDELDENLIEAIALGDAGLLDSLYTRSPIDLLGRCVRGLVCAPPGKVLVRRDYAQIECRLAHWLCGRAGEKMLDLFRKKDAAERTGNSRPEDDPYVLMAAKIFKGDIDVGVKNRKHGKTTELGSAFGMGAKKFAAQYGVDEFFAKQCIAAYRADKPWIVGIWSALDEAAMTCVSRGVPMRVGKLRFAMEGRWLTMQLPSGRKLYYFEPGIAFDHKRRPYVYYTKSYERREKMWGGIWLENACQAICRDLLAPAMMEMDRRGLAVILNVYDEIMVECDEQAADDALAEMAEIIENPPAWAAGLPIFSDPEVSKRFEKLE